MVLVFRSLRFLTTCLGLQLFGICLRGIATCTDASADSCTNASADSCTDASADTCTNASTNSCTHASSDGNAIQVIE
jgi:hypothetical protein